MVRANETWERKGAGQQNRLKESPKDSADSLGNQAMTGKKIEEWQFHKNYLSQYRS